MVKLAYRMLKHLISVQILQTVNDLNIMRKYVQLYIFLFQIYCIHLI